MTGPKTVRDPEGEAAGKSFPASGPLPVPQQGLRGSLSYLISCCPYTMLAKKVLRYLRGETGTPQEQLSNREIYLRSNIRIGYGIILIGIFCPFFWFAFFSGAQGNDLMFNAVHSGIVIVFGLLYFATYWIQLRNELVTEKHPPLPSQETR